MGSIQLNFKHKQILKNKKKNQRYHVGVISEQYGQKAFKGFKQGYLGFGPQYVDHGYSESTLERLG